MKKISKQIKPQNTDSNENSHSEDELLFRQTNKLKRYSSTLIMALLLLCPIKGKILTSVFYLNLIFGFLFVDQQFLPF